MHWNGHLLRPGCDSLPRWSRRYGNKEQCPALGFAEILMFPGTSPIPGPGEPTDPILLASLEKVAGSSRWSVLRAGTAAVALGRAQRAQGILAQCFSAGTVWQHRQLVPIPCYQHKEQHLQQSRWEKNVLTHTERKRAAPLPAVGGLNSKPWDWEAQTESQKSKKILHARHLPSITGSKGALGCYLQIFIVSLQQGHFKKATWCEVTEEENF